ncbi:hypothetical protein BDF20DRAFT_829063, partial [Mycotypha africana]|uniref:uncharacterized protein n=1 Tax=Mycotypha africana TaxID=64632 RepID=UPI00230084E2
LGTNVQFHISEAVGDVLVVSELDCVQLPLSLDELPQLVPYLGCLYNVVEVIHRLCYTSNAIKVNDSFGSTLEPKVIKAIMEKSTDRTRDHPFCHPYHSYIYLPLNHSISLSYNISTCTVRYVKIPVFKQIK